MRLVIPTLFLSVYSFITPKSYHINTITTKINTNNNKLYFKENNDDDKDDPDDIEDSGFLDFFSNNREKEINKLGWKSDNNDEDNDPVVKFAEFMGFERNEKWKAVRYTIYALVGGYIFSELAHQIGEDISNPFKGL